MIKVFTAFSGYDSQCLALQYLGLPYDLVGWSEIDKFAIQAHNVLFPEAAERNYGDISKIDWAQVPDFDLFTYSFPCQDISTAGLGKGFAEGSGTRSSLLWECKKAIEAKHPKYLLLENVKALVNKKNRPHFLQWLAWLEEQGYQNFTQVLNAKDYGVPQNRERVFVVSILGGGSYSFLQPQPLTIRLKDILEQQVDGKYYIDQEKVDVFFAFVCQIPPKKLEMLEGSEPINTTADGCAFAIRARYDGANLDSLTSGGGYYPNTGVMEIYDEDMAKKYRIRKFTPTECYRLMGVRDKEIETLKNSGIPNSQLYKMAGNSIVVDVLMGIFKQLFQPQESENQELKLF